jgi:AraC-like DNA-binding protein
LILKRVDDLQADNRDLGADNIRVLSFPQFHNLELLTARGMQHRFQPNKHEQYAIGVIENGALGFYYRHENWIAPTGSINLCIPGEVHTGHPAADDGWTYRMFYLAPEFLREIASEITGSPRDIPYFNPGVINDPILAAQISQVHKSLERQESSLMENETGILETLARMVIRHGDDPPALHSISAEPVTVARVKAYLQAHHAEDVSLEDLSRLTHLTRFHLLRVFRKNTGVPPHAYLRQVRVQQAKRLLADQSLDLSLADVASATGFTDQSHLTKWFKRLFGYTPGQYRNSVLYR